MTGGVSSQQRAAGLMRVALAILDEVEGGISAAAHLQTALDMLADVEPVEPDEGLLRQAALAADPAIVRAMGGALAIIGTLMERKGPISVGEISDMLGIYGAITAEAASDEGLILSYWAATLRDVAQGRNGRKMT